MASLKEIKDRINSVNGIMKITSAMKLVASSKLRKAQNAIGNLLPYQRQIHHILADLLAGEAETGELYITQRPLKKVAIVAFASNTSLCGAFRMRSGIFRKPWKDTRRQDSEKRISWSSP